MKRFYLTVSLLSVVFGYSPLSGLAQPNRELSPRTLKIDQKSEDFQIKRLEEHQFAIELEGGQRYSIVVEQKEIDLVLRLSDLNGHAIREQDSTNGNNGPEEILFAPESKGRYLITVLPNKKPNNPPAGAYSIRTRRISNRMNVYSRASLQQDFDLLVGSFKEADAGLDWYSTYKEYDEFCASQRKLIRDKMTGVEFYRVIAPIVAFTKEGHSAIRLSPNDSNYLIDYGRYLPFQVKFINKRAYVINDFDGIKSKGLLLTKINGKNIEEIVKTFLSVEPDDGFIESGKYRWIEQNGSFPAYYLRCFGSSPTFGVELTDPKTNLRVVLDKVRSVGYAERRRLWVENTPQDVIKFPAAKIEFRPEIKTAILIFNDFGKVFNNEKFDNKEFADNAFDEIKKRGVENLIIDLRKNEGGEEGFEDYVFSFLINKPYVKYRYVEALPANYSFLNYTKYKTKERQESLKEAITSEFYVASDGRLLRKPGYLPPAKPRTDAFTGKLYVLTSGLTFSGASEFAAIIKANREATFIGEETGGGYYGNTSGRYINITLPNSQISVRIPLLKFVVEAGGNIPFGRGVIPDYETRPTIEEYLGGSDPEIECALKLIQGVK